MENSTPDRTSPSRPGRFHRGHARLRHHPIPAPSAEPPGELTYGEALTLLKLALLPTPAIWRDAAGIRE